jgi:hypothetical protein
MFCRMVILCLHRGLGVEIYKGYKMQKNDRKNYGFWGFGFLYSFGCSTMLQIDNLISRRENLELVVKHILSVS